MSRVVCVHGIAQQVKGEDTLRLQWSSAIRDGLRRADPSGKSAAALSERDIRYAFYGHVFRPSGRTLTAGIHPFTAGGTTEFEQELLLAWWRSAAETDSGVIRPDARTLMRSPQGVQTALRALSGSQFFGDLAERALIFDAVQVRRYFTQPGIRQAIQQIVADAVTENTRVIVGHSLGSVIAYEALAANPNWRVSTLVTLGSPLGIRGLIFDRLHPSPSPPLTLDGTPLGHWPGRVTTWTNIADDGDAVALVKDLRPLFTHRVICKIIHNGAKAHDIIPYLTAAETGTAILSAL